MNRLHWCLLLASIPIVVAAQFVLHYKEATILQFVDRADGSGAALLDVSSGYPAGNRIEVIAWDAGMGNPRTLSRKPMLNAKRRQLIAADSDGRFVVVPGESGVSCLDGATGREIWFAGQQTALQDATRVEFMNHDKHLLVIKQGEDNRASLASILSVASGKRLAGIAESDVARCLAKENRIAIQHGRGSERFGQWDLFSFDGDEARFIESADFAPREMIPVAKNIDLDISTTTKYYWNAPYSWRFVSGQDATLQRRVRSKHGATVKVLPANQFRPDILRSTDPEVAKTIRASVLGFGESVALLSMVALAVAVWVTVLVLEGASSSWKDRPLVDALAITILFVVLFVPLAHRWSQTEGSTPAFQRSTVITFFDGPVVAFFAALVMVAGISGLLTQMRPFYLWGGFILACALPVLLPPIAVIFFLLFRGFRMIRSTKGAPLGVAERLSLSMSEPEQDGTQKSKFRFGIGEVMLLTLGIALFIAIGHVSFFLIIWGGLLAVILALSVVLTGESIQSTTLFVSAFALTIFGAGHRLWDLSGTSVFIFALPLFFSLAAVHHYRVAKPVAKLVGEP